MILKELPEIKDQWRPRYQPKSIINSSIRLHNARGADTETLNGKCFMLGLEYGKKTGDSWTLEPRLYYTSSFVDVLNAFLDCGRVWYKGGKVGFTHPSYFWWNLKFDSQALLKHLPNRIIDEIYINKKAHFNFETFEMVDWEAEGDFSKTVEVFLLPKKTLRFTFHKTHTFQPTNSTKWVNGGVIEMWDIAQFYGGSLNNNSKRFLGDNKTETLFDGSPLDVKKLGKRVMVKVKTGYYVNHKRVLYEEYYKEDIEFYCMKDAVLCGRLARKKIREFVEAEVLFKSPYSIASIAQYDLLFKEYKEVIPDPEKYRVPLKIALTAYHGGWFEAAKVGFFEDCMYVDLKSAYLYSQYHLPSMTRWNPVMTKDGKRQRIKKGQPLFESELRGCFVFQSDEAEGKPTLIREELLSIAEPRTDHSPIYVHVDVEFKEGSAWNPLCYVGEYGAPLTTPRIFSGWITYDEYAEAYKWPHEYFNANRFCAWIDDEEESEYPFRHFIDYWYDVKESKDPSDPAYTISKQLAVSPYGKTIQDIEGRSGALYHPHYASMTTGICRMSIARFLRHNDLKPLMVAIDGVLIQRKDLKSMPKRYFDARSNLGEWEIEAEDVDAVVLLSGVYGFIERSKFKKTLLPIYDGGQNKIRFEEVKESITKSKARGSAQYFINKYGSWFSFLAEHENESEVSLEIERPYSLGEARRIVNERLENGDYEKSAVFDLMNIFDKREFTLKACGDSSKRFYDDENRPETFGDLLNGQFTLKPYDAYWEVDYVLSGGKS